MSTQNATIRAVPMLSRATLGWLAAALVLGSAGALAGLPVLFGALTIAGVVIFMSVVKSSPSQVMAASIWALALCPFSLGIETGVLPKLFADEMLLLPYLLVLFPLYLVSDRVWQSGFARYFWLLAAFVICQSLSLVVQTDLIAFRDLLETYVLGPMLLVVFLQEAANTDRDEFLANSVIWLVAVVAVLSVVERVIQHNPLLEHMELDAGYHYLSPQIVALTEGVYRPYVTFFHPSETGTFMALGLPFAIRRWMQRRNLLSATLVLLICAGLGVNATRGVWVGAALSLLLLARNPIMIVLTAIPVAGLGGFAAFIALRSTAFWLRLSDLNNLLGRFIYWQLGAEVFADHKILGVGHMQFQKVYLDYVKDVSQLAQIDLKQIYVMDNVYLTTLVEHGIIGLVALLAFFIVTGVTLKRFHKKLLLAGLEQQATLVRAVRMALVVYAASGFFADVNQFTKATKFFFILIGFGMGVAARSLNAAKRAQSPDVPATHLQPEYAR
jgi:O-antigen ligase